MESRAWLSLEDDSPNTRGKKTRAKILVVDDEQCIRAMLRAVLTNEGYDVSEADDGTTAIKAVGNQPFDFIFMDVCMGEMDGIAALREIKKMNPMLPVVIMTAQPSFRSAVDALKSGAYDYLSKPLNIHELRALVEKGLEHCRR